MTYRTPGRRLGLGLAAWLALSACVTPALADQHGGGGHGGGGGGAGRGGGGVRHGRDGGGHRGGRGGYGGWGGGYYPGPAVIYGAPFYCEPPLVYAPYSGYDYCE